MFGVRRQHDGHSDLQEHHHTCPHTVPLWCRTRAYGVSPYIGALCFVSIRLLRIAGTWTAGEPTGCATKCGVAEGASGTAGAVTCSTSSCNESEKPNQKRCPKTADCGMWWRKVQQHAFPHGVVAQGSVHFPCVLQPRGNRANSRTNTRAQQLARSSEWLLHIAEVTQCKVHFPLLCRV